MEQQVTSTMEGLDLVLKGETIRVDDETSGLGEYFYNMMKKKPDPRAIFMVDGTTYKNLTFGQFLDRSIRLAHGFRNLGLKKGDCIAVVSENRLDYLVPFMSGQFIGAALNLVNPDYTKRELLHLFAICKPVMVICPPAKVDELKEVQKDASYLKHIWHFDEFQKYEVVVETFDVATEIDADKDVAVILCSSGTTGQPKCVALTHNNIKYQFLNCYPQYLDISAKDVLFANLPFFHIMGLMIPLAGLVVTIKSIIMAKFQPDAFLNAIEKYKITKLLIVPPLALFLSKSPSASAVKLASVRDIICGAAALPTSVEAELKNKFNIVVRQVYGCTESSAVSILSKGVEKYTASCGTLICNFQAKIVDIENGNLLGPGQTGEICCKSPTVMKGYLGDEEANKIAFDSDGFLRTGDIGYFNGEGHLFITERLKELIKYKGFQVPPAELENILMSHQEIADAGVIGIPDEKAGELPKAFVVKKAGSNVTESEIVEFVSKQVSVQKQLHGGVQFVESIPKSSSGKILRKLLRDNVYNSA